MSKSLTNNIYAVQYTGTSSIINPLTRFSSIELCLINTYSNGNGIKRVILVTGSVDVFIKNSTIYIENPRETDSSGSYVGIETNDPSNNGSIVIKSTTVSCIVPTTGQLYTASDILQTTPTTQTDPSFSLKSGIQVGPGTELSTRTAGGKGFTIYTYPFIIFYGLKGNLSQNDGYLWPGTLQTGGSVPDNTTPPAFFRIQQPCIICGISAALNIPTGTILPLTLTVEYTSILTGTLITTPITVSYYNSTVRLITGDLLHLYLLSPNGLNAHDLSAQIDLY